MGFLATLADFLLHTNLYLDTLVSEYGVLIYAILFAIVFLETGVVVTPFLPGDSLMFAAGALAGTGLLNVYVLIAVFVSAAILGDGVNYWVGRTAGERLLSRYPRLIKPEHLRRTEEFFEVYGGRAIVLGRFVPIVRTLVPFVAGAGSMSWSRFTRFNVFGALLWVLLAVPAGYFLGGIPFVQENFSLVLVLVVIISFAPVLFEYWRPRRRR